MRIGTIWTIICRKVWDQDDALLLPIRRVGVRLARAAGAADQGAKRHLGRNELGRISPRPGKFVRGTKMVYFVPNEKDRQDMIAYVTVGAHRNLGHVGLARRTGFPSIEAQRA
jgi:hypothetical protein